MAQALPIQEDASILMAALVGCTGGVLAMLFFVRFARFQTSSISAPLLEA